MTDNKNKKYFKHKTKPWYYHTFPCYLNPKRDFVEITKEEYIDIDKQMYDEYLDYLLRWVFCHPFQFKEYGYDSPVSYSNWKAVRQNGRKKNL